MTARNSVHLVAGRSDEFLKKIASGEFFKIEELYHPQNLILSEGQTVYIHPTDGNYVAIGKIIMRRMEGHLRMVVDIIEGKPEKIFKSLIERREVMKKSKHQT